MNAFLSFLEKLLTVIFSVGFAALAIALLIHFNRGEEEVDPWQRVKKQNTVEAYLDYLRDCQFCPHLAEAEKALDEAQKSRGLVARLAQTHLPARASIALPAFSPDGRTVLAAAGAGPGFWDAETGQHLVRNEAAFTTRGGHPVDTLDYSSDGRLIAGGTAGAEGGSLWVWDAQGSGLVAEQPIEGYDVQTVAFAPQGSLLGWLAHGPTGVWDPTGGKFLRASHADARDLAFFRGKTGQLWLLTAEGREVWFWDPSTMELARQVRFNTDRPLLGLSRDGRLTAFSDGPVLDLWDTLTGLQVATLANHDGQVLSFCRDPQKGWVAVGTESGVLYLWDPVSSALLGAIPAHTGPVRQLACSTRSQAITIGWDGAKIWSLEKLRLKQAHPSR